MQALASCGVLLTYLDKEREFSASHGLGKNCPERPLTEALSDLLSGIIISEFTLLSLTCMHAYIRMEACICVRFAFPVSLIAILFSQNCR